MSIPARAEAAVAEPRADGRGARPGRPRFWMARQIARARLGAFGLATVVLFVVMAAGAGLISPYDPNAQSMRDTLRPPSLAHPLGTDELGRDVLSRLIYGSRISLQVGLVSVALATGLGIAIGLVAGYYGGWVDEALMRVVDAAYAFPALLLALAIAAALGPGIGNVMLAVGVVYMPVFARLVRGQVLSVREREFVTAARVLGAGTPRLLLLHIWPNVTAPIVVQASLSVSFAIITEAALSFLGVGVQPPTPSWGSMLRVGYQFMDLAPWLSLVPGAAIFVTVLGLNVLGDALRLVLDPRLRLRGES